MPQYQQEVRRAANIIFASATCGTLGDSEDDKKKKDELHELVKKTARSLASYGHQQNKNVAALVVSELEAHAMEIDPFDTDRLKILFSRCRPPVRSVSFRLSLRDAFLPSFLSLRAFLQLREPLPAAVHHPRVSLSERVGPRHLVSMVVVVVVVTVAAGGAQVGERVRRARRVPELAVREHRDR